MKAKNSYLRQPYARIVIPDDKGGFHAEILEFPGCYAQGDNLQDAYKNLEAAAKAWIDACIESGQTIPEPFSSIGFSGRFALRLPKSVHRRAAQFAERDRSSLNTYLVSAISAKVGAEEFYTTLAQRFERHIWTLMGAAFHQWSVTSATTNVSNGNSAQMTNSIAATGSAITMPGR